MFKERRYKCNITSKDVLQIQLSKGDTGKYMLFKTGTEIELHNHISAFISQKEACELARDILAHYTNKLLEIKK